MTVTNKHLSDAECRQIAAGLTNEQIAYSIYVASRFGVKPFKLAEIAAATAISLSENDKPFVSLPRADDWPDYDILVELPSGAFVRIQVKFAQQEGAQWDLKTENFDPNLKQHERPYDILVLARSEIVGVKLKYANAFSWADVCNMNPQYARPGYSRIREGFFRESIMPLNLEGESIIWAFNELQAMNPIATQHMMEPYFKDFKAMVLHMLKDPEMKAYWEARNCKRKKDKKYLVSQLEKRDF